MRDDRLVTDLLERLAEVIRGIRQHSQRVLVGVDGPDASGKTTLADRLASELHAADQPAPRCSIDAFHRPRADRYRRGELSAAGYYRDSFDLDAFLDGCARPFLGGADHIITGSFDFRTDAATDPHRTTVELPAVLLVDGVFLLRPELAGIWTLSVYLHISPEETLRRALHRDARLMGSTEEVRRRYLGRYLPGQALYRAEADPESVADIVVDNARPHAPRVRHWRPRGL